MVVVFSGVWHSEAASRQCHGQVRSVLDRNSFQKRSIPDLTPEPTVPDHQLYTDMTPSDVF